MLDISGLTVIADYFVICSGTSQRMLSALAKAVNEVVHEKYDIKTRVEGEAQTGWLLADFGDVVVHFFSLDQRDYYQLEELWSAAKVLVRLQ